MLGHAYTYCRNCNRKKLQTIREIVSKRVPATKKKRKHYLDLINLKENNCVYIIYIALVCNYLLTEKKKN